MMAEPGRHGRTPAEEQTGCYSLAEVRSVRLLSPPHTRSAPLRGTMGTGRASATRHSPRGSKTAPFPFTAVIKSVEKQHLAPPALRAKMHPSIRT